GAGDREAGRMDFEHQIQAGQAHGGATGRAAEAGRGVGIVLAGEWSAAVWPATHQPDLRSDRGGLVLGREEAETFGTVGVKGIDPGAFGDGGGRSAVLDDDDLTRR